MSPARRLAVVLLALACSAIGLWVATRLVWLHVEYQSALRGPGTLRAPGARIRPELGAIALVAVAAGAAAVAVSGWPRRVLGGLVALVGVWAVWLSATPPGSSAILANTGASSLDVADAAHHLPADAVVVATTSTGAPYLASAAAALLALAGVALIGWANRLPRLGARYAAPGGARRVPDRDSHWWSALDAGEDPTLPGSEGPRPGSEPAPRRALANEERTERGGEQPGTDPGTSR